MADLKELRKKAGWTQDKLSQRINVSTNTIQNWENGRTMPTFEIFQNYLKELGVTNIEDQKRIFSEMIPSSSDEEIEPEVDNIPYFLFGPDDQRIEFIKECHATAEELDMLGYVDYMNKRGAHARIEGRKEIEYPLEFAFFEKYGGFYTTMKRLKDTKVRLGGLRGEALEFAAQNPGCDYSLRSLDKKDMLDKIGPLLQGSSYSMPEVVPYDRLKEIYSGLQEVGTDGVLFTVGHRKQNHPFVRKLMEISEQNLASGKGQFGPYYGYIAIERGVNEAGEAIEMLKLSERGRLLIEWFQDVEE